MITVTKFDWFVYRLFRRRWNPILKEQLGMRKLLHDSLVAPEESNDMGAESER